MVYTFLRYNFIYFCQLFLVFNNKAILSFDPLHMRDRRIKNKQKNKQEEEEDWNTQRVYENRNSKMLRRKTEEN